MLAVFSFVAHAETGYNGIEWYTELEVVGKNREWRKSSENGYSFEDAFEFSSNAIRNETKTIFGKPNELTYYFVNKGGLLAKDAIDDDVKRLLAVLYMTERKNLSKRISQYTDIVKEYDNLYSNMATIQTSTEEKAKKFNSISKSEQETALKIQLLFLTRFYEREGKSYIPRSALSHGGYNEKEGKLYIYDHNEDTRVYIYDNVVKNKIVCIYLQKPENGYNGLKWAETYDEVKSKILLETTLEDVHLMYMLSSVDIHTHEDIVFDRKNKVTYLFCAQQFSGVGFIFNMNEFKNIQNKLKEKRGEQYKTNFQLTEQNYFFSNKKISELVDTHELYNTSARTLCITNSINYLIDGNDENSVFMLKEETEKNKNMSGTFYVYSYNDDTNMHVYDNIFKDIIVAVLVPKSKKIFE